MKRIIFAIMIVLNLGISGCISQTIDEDGIPVPDNISTTDDGELVIVTYDVYGLTEHMLANFENVSGYNITMTKLDDAGSVLDHLLQYKGAQVSDLAIGLDNTYLQTAIDNNVLWPHEVNLSGLSEIALAPYDGVLAAPFDHGYICLNYDSSVVDGTNYTVPTSLWDLTSSEWAGKVAIPSPESSSPGRIFMTATTDYFANDDDNTTEWTDWWTAMKNNDVIITSGWSEAYVTHYTGGYGVWEDDHIGDAHIVVSYCHSPGVEAWYGSNYTISTALDLPRASLHQVEYAAAVQGGNLAAARAFIEYLISEEVNLDMPIENSMYSVINGTDLPEENGYRYHSVVPTQPADVSPSEIASNMEAWLEMWNAAMVDA